MNYKREYEKLIKKADDLPGVAELMTAYKRLEKSYQANQQYLQQSTPDVVVTASDTSTRLTSIQN